MKATSTMHIPKGEQIVRMAIRNFITPHILHLYLLLLKKRLIPQLCLELILK